MEELNESAQKFLNTGSTYINHIAAGNKSKGKRAITNYKTIKIFENNKTPTLSLIECKLETGRTHQIRVHMKYKGSSLLGDNQYGKKNMRFKNINEDFFKNLSVLNGQALHAKSSDEK